MTQHPFVIVTLLFVLSFCTLLPSVLGHGADDVVELNSPDDVDRLFSPTKPLFVKFYTPWCSHCKQLAPVWSKMATALKDEVTLAHVDCTVEDHSFCTSFGVRSYPTLKLIADGKLYSYTGPRTEAEMTAFAKGEYKEEGAAQEIPKKPPTLSDYVAEDGSLKQIDSKQSEALEQVPGMLPSQQETYFPVQNKHSSLKGTPGPSPSMGSPDAPVKVFLFSDFQCPNCRRVAEPLKWLSMKYPKEVQVIFKQLPLAMHKKALPAAKAALAAGKQNKFWDYHDLIWKTRKINQEELELHAKTLGLDLSKWNRDRESDAIKEEIEYDISLAGAIGLSGTPGIVVNGHTSKSWGSIVSIENTITAVLRTLPELQKNASPHPIPTHGLAYMSTTQNNPNIANLIWGVETEKTEL